MVTPRRSKLRNRQSWKTAQKSPNLRNSPGTALARHECRAAAGKRRHQQDGGPREEGAHEAIDFTRQVGVEGHEFRCHADGGPQAGGEHDQHEARKPRSRKMRAGEGAHRRPMSWRNTRLLGGGCNGSLTADFAALRCEISHSAARQVLPNVPAGPLQRPWIRTPLRGSRQTARCRAGIRCGPSRRGRARGGGACLCASPLCGSRWARVSRSLVYSSARSTSSGRAWRWRRSSRARPMSSSMMVVEVLRGP